MTITTRNEVLVTCENAPLMELLRHLVAEHAEDVDYCLSLMDWYAQLGVEPQPRLLTEPAQIKRLAPGTIIKDADGKLYYNCGKWWASLESIARSVIDEILATSIQLPATAVYTPGVQA
ncbi:hypothetical protein NQ028_09235 [Corynebacterium phoceense]|uniref:hypothetical protein n=1 Tax=Corynebacterium phoceense TaxID=1686286 RepID=UPI00211CA1B1|nr:hypothetical protein [Corynebacterium phoceense]MCQ9341318.1 hypothetical protein [Corynebacterium phoceense]